ncbi:glucose-6-phosphate dehydrogenase [Bacteroidota bacterium]
MKVKQNLGIVIFGASGDLTERKLIPALFNLYKLNYLPDRFFILGVGRKNLDDNAFRDKLRLNTGDSKSKEFNTFAGNLYYESINTKDIREYENLNERIQILNKLNETGSNFIYYLAVPPVMYAPTAEYLSSCALNTEDKSWKRLIVEKPFGYDLQSAKELNQELRKYFREHQMYRIDHYLGKETVQNILVTRFSNAIFEPLWNRNFIHHVEITSSENEGVGSRAGYYDKSGALRDMLQNHLLQLVGLVAMEPPSLSDSTAIRNESLKVFQSLKPLTAHAIQSDVIRGQYGESTVRGNKYNSYRDEEGVEPDSRTETYVAMKFFIDNWRWSGVPFYIRTGKRLPTKVTEIVIHFQQIPHRIFNPSDVQLSADNQLIIRIQPDEGILLKFGMKVPGAGFIVQHVGMDFHYSSLSEMYLPTAYERLLLDCMTGDSTLYARGDIVEETWKFVNPVLDFWKNNPDAPLYGYPSGTWGPENADSLIEGENITWRYPCKNLANDGEYCEL